MFISIIFHLQKANYATDGVSNPCLHSGNSEIHDGHYLFKAPCSDGPPTDMPDISYDTQFIFNGTSNYDECTALVADLFVLTADCAQPPCSFNIVHQPKPQGTFLVGC